jgi:hypothetical protein
MAHRLSDIFALVQDMHENARGQSHLTPQGTLSIYRFAQVGCFSVYSEVLTGQGNVKERFKSSEILVDDQWYGWWPGNRMWTFDDGSVLAMFDAHFLPTSYSSARRLPSFHSARLLEQILDLTFPKGGWFRSQGDSENEPGSKEKCV